MTVSWWRRHVGLDFVDTLIHVGVTMMLMIVAVEASIPNEEVGLSLVVAASLLVFAWRRKVAMRNLPLETTGQGTAVRLEDLEARMAEFDLTTARVAELEERLDFAERMLAQRSEPARLSQGDGA